MPKFRRKGPNCYAALDPASNAARPVRTGEVIEAPMHTGWAEDPGWELVVDEPKETEE